MKIIDLYLVYRILRKLTTPFKEWDAFKYGIIDDEGNVTKKPQDRKTPEEKDSFTLFDVLILRLKRLLEKLPFGKTRLASYAAALFLIREQANLDENNVEELFERFYHDHESEFLSEEIANNVGGGNIAGTTGDPPKGSKTMLRRFANNDVFVVDQERYLKARLGKRKYLKYENYVGIDEVGEDIRQYGRKYPNKPIILQCERTGAMTFLRYGKSGMFKESLDATKSPKYVTDKDLKEVERYADSLFKAVGVDIQFTKHFVERVNDERNIKQITIDELIELFRKTFKMYGTRIPKLGKDAEAVLNDMKTNINLPFVLKWDDKSQELDLVAKTVMRKKNFMTPNKKLVVQ
jgi:hypothetical protein